MIIVYCLHIGMNGWYKKPAMDLVKKYLYFLILLVELTAELTNW